MFELSHDANRLTLILHLPWYEQVTEVSAPSAFEFAGAAEVSTFTRQQLLLAERALLRELEYYLYHPTPSSFSGAYLSVTLPHLKKVGHSLTQ